MIKSGGYWKRLCWPCQIEILWNLFRIPVLVLVLLILPWTCKADEPWYYQTDSDYRFLIPDKVQHFYGSYFLTDLTGAPAATLAALLWECRDAAAGGAFSINDLVADALGIASSLLNNKAETTLSPRCTAALEWRRQDQVIIFFVKMTL